jgi:hypothetical protein
MSSTKVKMTLTAYFQVEGTGERAIENAMDKAHIAYGLEAYEYGDFIIEGESNE